MLDVDAFDQMFADDQDAALDLLTQMAQATDRELAALARRLAGRLVLELARTGRARSRGVGRLTTGRADESSADLDIDASLDGLMAARVERRPPHMEDLHASRWELPQTALCLLIDRSGSMSGARLASAALAAAVCAWRAPDQFAVFAFSDRVVELKGIEQTKASEKLVGEVLGLRGHGTTDVALALRAAGAELAGSRATRRMTVLLSDAEVTTGDDPVPSARALDELVILAPDDDPSHANALAMASGARVTEVGGPMSVLDALRRVVQ